ncbi:ABC transporter permease [Microbacterium sp.]|uniref:ABC transporter permease n=1 Tax=Microbacterium sp. TaxID=51671 RepID=UPI003C20213D
MTATDSTSDVTHSIPAEAALRRESPLAARSGRGRFGTAVARFGPPLAVLAGILIVWYIAALVLEADGKGFLLPTPNEVIAAGLFDPEVRGDIWESLLRTTGVALTGLAIAIVIGVTWAVSMALASWIERSTFAYAVILQTIPILALVPLIGFWFGFEFTARVIVCVLIALFPMVSNTLFGLQSVEKSQHELFKLQKASKWIVLSKLMMPAALPAIFVGIRTSAGLAVIGAIVGDYFFRRGDPGIGSLISNYTSRLQGAELFAAILAACLLGVVIFAAFGWLAKAAVGRWYEPAS